MLFRETFVFLHVVHAKTGNLIVAQRAKVNRALHPLVASAHEVGLTSRFATAFC